MEDSGVCDEKAFYQLFRILASQSVNLLNTNELSDVLHIRDETTNAYLEVLQKYFHIQVVNPFYRNLRKELTKMPKVYLMDTGMRNSLLNDFRPLNERLDKGLPRNTLVVPIYVALFGRFFPANAIIIIV